MEGELKFIPAKERLCEPKVGDRVIISDLDNPECHGAVGKIYYLKDGLVSVALDMGIDVWEGSIDCIRLKSEENKNI